MHLGIDLGTSSLKALVIDSNQRLVASATSAEIPIYRPHPGWCEQEPADWIRACSQALAVLARDHPAAMAAVRGIGLSGHMHGATLIDKADQPIRRCILWNDTRSHGEAAMLDGLPAFRAITGNIVFPGFTAPKLLWAARNEPENFARVRYVLLPKDYLRLWLSGEHLSEMSDAAGTAWLDVRERRWSAELLGHAGLDESAMPGLIEGTQTGGRLRADLASGFGMPANVPIAGGAGDNAAAAAGLGAVAEGQSFVSLGTSGVLFSANDAFRPLPESAVHTFCHAVPGKWHQMGVILSATASLNWFAKLVGRSATELTAGLGDDLRAGAGPLFLPYLSGERTPHNDAGVRGTFFGFAHEDDVNSLTNSVLEGVAFALADSLTALNNAHTFPLEAYAAGGGTNSVYWLKLMATVLGLPIHVPVNGDFGAAFGAARLGMISAENLDPLSVLMPPAIARSFMPETALRDGYLERLAKYRELYAQTKGIRP